MTVTVGAMAGEDEVTNADTVTVTLTDDVIAGTTADPVGLIIAAVTSQTTAAGGDANLYPDVTDSLAGASEPPCDLPNQLFGRIGYPGFQSTTRLSSPNPHTYVFRGLYYYRVMNDLLTGETVTIDYSGAGGTHPLLWLAARLHVVTGLASITYNATSPWNSDPTGDAVATSWNGNSTRTLTNPASPPATLPGWRDFMVMCALDTRIDNTFHWEHPTEFDMDEEYEFNHEDSDATGIGCHVGYAFHDWGATIDTSDDITCTVAGSGIAFPNPNGGVAVTMNRAGDGPSCDTVKKINNTFGLG